MNEPAADTPAIPGVPPAGPAAVEHPIARVLPLLSPAHLDRDFDYLVPPELDAIAQPGVRVRVRFAGRLVDGYLLERRTHSDHSGKLVKLERVVSAERVLPPEILELATTVAARYAGTRADVLRLAIPPRHARTEIGGSKKKSVDLDAGQADSAVDASESASNAARQRVSAVKPPLRAVLPISVSLDSEAFGTEVDSNRPSANAETEAARNNSSDSLNTGQASRPTRSLDTPADAAKNSADSEARQGGTPAMSDSEANEPMSDAGAFVGEGIEPGAAPRGSMPEATPPSSDRGHDSVSISTAQSTRGQSEVAEQPRGGPQPGDAVQPIAGRGVEVAEQPGRGPQPRAGVQLSDGRQPEIAEQPPTGPQSNDVELSGISEQPRGKQLSGDGRHAAGVSSRPDIERLGGGRKAGVGGPSDVGGSSDIDGQPDIGQRPHAGPQSNDVEQSADNESSREGRLSGDGRHVGLSAGSRPGTERLGGGRKAGLGRLSNVSGQPDTGEQRDGAPQSDAGRQASDAQQSDGGEPSPVSHQSVVVGQAGIDKQPGDSRQSVVGVQSHDGSRSDVAGIDRSAVGQSGVGGPSVAGAPPNIEGQAHGGPQSNTGQRSVVGDAHDGLRSGDGGERTSDDQRSGEAGRSHAGPQSGIDEQPGDGRESIVGERSGDGRQSGVGGRAGLGGRSGGGEPGDGPGAVDRAAWGRYVHGGAFLGALAGGRGRGRGGRRCRGRIGRDGWRSWRRWWPGGGAARF